MADLTDKQKEVRSRLLNNILRKKNNDMDVDKRVSSSKLNVKTLHLKINEEFGLTEKGKRFGPREIKGGWMVETLFRELLKKLGMPLANS